MSMVVSQITGISIVYSTVCSGTDQRKHQSSASPVTSEGPGTWKMFPFHDTIMISTEYFIRRNLNIMIFFDKTCFKMSSVKCLLCCLSLDMFKVHYHLINQFLKCHPGLSDKNAIWGHRHKNPVHWSPSSLLHSTLLSRVTITQKLRLWCTCYLPKFTIFGKYVRLSVCLSVCLSVSLSVLSSITHERFDISSPNSVHIWNGWAVPVCDIDK